MSIGVVLLSFTAGADAQSLVDWQADAPANPLPSLSGMAFATDPVTSRIVAFGGNAGGGVYSADTWTYDGTTWTRLQGMVAPPARTNASMAFDQASGTLVMFGGYDGRRYLGDTWIFDPATDTWSQANPASSPAAVTGPMLFTDPLTGHVADFGGFDGQFYQLETWRWTGVTWRRLSPAHTPSARSAAVVANDEAHGTVVMFGGLAQVNPYNTWTWDGTDWTQQLPSTMPPNRYDGRAAYDPDVGVVMFGGAEGGLALSDTWVWTGSDWVERTPANAPGGRELHLMAWLPSVGRIVVAGGETRSVLRHDTWSLAWLGRFDDLGPGIGAGVAPVLAASGDLTPGSATGVTLTVDGMPANAPVQFVAGDAAAVPFGGGTAYTSPVLAHATVNADASGHAVLRVVVPANVASGTEVAVQAWAPDPNAPGGLDGTNGLLATVP